MEKKKMRVKSVFLALELIMEILLRLPVKTILCCRCVCKSWLSLISNNNFVTSHFEHAATHRRLLIKRYARQPLSIDVDSSLDDASAYASLSLDIFPSQSGLEIRGSCRGFLFLHDGTYIYLVNPSTSLIKQIPNSPIIHIDGFKLLSGFAYDHSTDDYLIVLGFCEDLPVTSSIKLMIYSLRANKWKSIEVDSHLPYKVTSIATECVTICGLFLNGSIHWMFHNYETSKNVIIAFDIKKMTISNIAMSNDFIFSYSNNYSIYYDLLDVGGLIGACMKDLSTMKIYVMQEYGVHSSWTKIIQFSVDPVLHSYLYIVCLTKCGDIVGTNDKGELMKFNDKGQLLEHPSCHNLNSDIFHLVVYTESLYSLPGTGQT